MRIHPPQLEPHLPNTPTPGTIGKRLEKAGISNTPESRRAYRELLYTAPRIGGALSGVIMFKETLGQCAGDGTPFVEVLRRQGVLVGVKVDEVSGVWLGLGLGLGLGWGWGGFGGCLMRSLPVATKAIRGFH